AKTDQGSQPNPGVVNNNVINPTVTGNLQRETALVGLNYALTRSVTLLTGFGYEEIKDSTLATNIKGPFGSFGIGITGSRLTLNLNYNLRYNSKFISVQGSWDISDQLQVKMTYGESIQTQQSLAIQQASNIGFNSSGVFIDPATGQRFSASPLAGGVNNGLGNGSFL